MWYNRNMKVVGDIGFIRSVMRIIVTLVMICFFSVSFAGSNVIGSISYPIRLGENVITLPDAYGDYKIEHMHSMKQLSNCFCAGDIVTVEDSNTQYSLFYDGDHWTDEIGASADDVVIALNSDTRIGVMRKENKDTILSLSVALSKGVDPDVDWLYCPEGSAWVGDVLWTYHKLGDSEVSVSKCFPVKKEVVIPETLDGLKVVNVPVYIFLVDRNVEQVCLPKTIKSIGYGNAIANNYNLNFIEVSPENPYLEDHDGCLYSKGLKKLLAVPCARKVEHWPEGLIEIGAMSMHGHKYLSELRLPLSVRKIGGHAFAGCRNLRVVELPDDVETLEFQTFSWCYDIKSVRLPKNLKLIHDEVFMWCRKIESISIPEKVELIHTSAFRGCSGIREVEYLPLAAPRGNPFKDVSPDAVIRVRRESTGWGVPIPGVWNNLRIEYID